MAVLWVPLRLFSLLAAVANCMVLKLAEHEERRQAANGSRRMELKNYQDLCYTATVQVGGQSVQAIFDTGSFEFVVLSRDCKNCGNKRKKLYSTGHSKTYQNGGMASSCTYGSGTAYTRESYDNVEIQDLTAPHQFFWRVYDADDSLSDLFVDDPFGAILGCGPSSSVLSFAEFELNSVQKEVEEFGMRGGKMSSKIESIVKTYQDSFELAKTSSTILDALSIHDMSVCLQRCSGCPGSFVWNDEATMETPSKFLEVPVVGDFYWSAELSNVRIGEFNPDVDNKLSLDESTASLRDLGCSKHKCTAVVDSGTTLIVVPSTVAYAVDDILYEWEDRGGSCDDLSKLPNLEFKLGDNLLTLPPEAYVAKYTGSGLHVEENRRVLPQLYRRMKKASSNTTGEFCASMLSPMDADSQFGPLWIFGMSFFRHYYTNFHMVPSGRTLKGSTMFFSVPTPDCRPQLHPAEQFLAQAAIGALGKRRVEFNLDVSKIRPSALVDRINRMATPRIPGLTDLRFATFQSPLVEKPKIHI